MPALSDLDSESEDENDDSYYDVMPDLKDIDSESDDEYPNSCSLVSQKKVSFNLDTPSDNINPIIANRPRSVQEIYQNLGIIYYVYGFYIEWVWP